MNSSASKQADTGQTTDPLDRRFGEWFRRVVTFNRMEVVSLTHSVIYFALLISRFRARRAATVDLHFRSCRTA